MEYRLVAELLRALRLVAPLGGGGPFPQIPAHWASYGQPGATWMAWYARAVERALGLPSVPVTREYIKTALEDLHALIRKQVRFHSDNARRCHNIDRRLHVGGVTLVALTLMACGLHLALGFLHPHGLDWAESPLTFCAGFFPALGAALAVKLFTELVVVRTRQKPTSLKKTASLIAGRFQYVAFARIRLPDTI